jgi:hypothetical protein
MTGKRYNWIRDTWRPAMGWMYLTVCISDFILFPIIWGYAHIYTQTPLEQWNPITLQGSGLFHVAMGAILGVTAWGRTKEKMSGTVYDKYLEESDSSNNNPN